MASVSRNAFAPGDASDLPLFAAQRVLARKPATEQQRQLDRVESRITTAVLDFCAGRITDGRPVFAASELRAYVDARHAGAPGSPDRVLRDLRQRGRVAYNVVSRAASLYELTAVPR